MNEVIWWVVVVAVGGVIGNLATRAFDKARERAYRGIQNANRLRVNAWILIVITILQPLIVAGTVYTLVSWTNGV